MELISTIPTASPVPNVKRPAWLVWVAPAAVVAVALIAWAGWSYFSKKSEGDIPGGAKFHTVVPTELKVQVFKEGELQAVNNIDIPCLVEGGSTIVSIVKEGAQVKKGDTLVVLDSAAINERIETTTLDVRRAESDVTTSNELLQIQESQNSANLEAANVELELAKLALEQYLHGTFPQELANAETALKMAKITVANQESDLGDARELFDKKFVTGGDVKKLELALTTVTNTLRQAETTLEVLTKYAHPMALATNKSAVAQAELKLARTQKENASNLSKAKADVAAKEEALAILKKREKRLGDQLANCTILAPADGLVIYNAASSDRYSNSGIIQEGSPVRERQVLLRLPDTTAMKAIVKINETQVARLSKGQPATVRINGVLEPVAARVDKISPVSESGSRWFSDVREYPVEMVLDWTPNDLKPGIGVQTEILIDRVADALSVPLTALYTEGADSFVFVRSGDEVKPTKVTVAQASETQVRVTSGLTSGAEVMLLQPGQGRSLLEKHGITPTPVTQTVAKARPEGDRPREEAMRPAEPGTGGGGPPGSRPGGTSRRPRGPDGAAGSGGAPAEAGTGERPGPGRRPEGVSGGASVGAGPSSGTVTSSGTGERGRTSPGSPAVKATD